MAPGRVSKAGGYQTPQLSTFNEGILVLVLRGVGVRGGHLLSLI